MTLFIIAIILLLLFNQLIRCSNWYKLKYADVIRIRSDKKEKKIIALGSNQTKFGIYAGGNASICSLAMGPQSLEYDFLLTKERIRVDDGGSIIIVICPFSSLLVRFSIESNKKYYLLLSKRNIPDYSLRKALIMKIEYFFPFVSVLFNPRLIKQILSPQISSNLLESNPMNELELKKDAKRWIDGWLKQFDMQSLDLPLEDKHREALLFNQIVLSDLIQFCKEHHLVPYFVILPVTNFVSDYFTEEVQTKLIFDLIAPFVSEVSLLNYFEDPRFKDKDLYFNSFFLNARGRKEFTKVLLTDLKQ